MRSAISCAVFLGLVFAAGCLEKPAPWTPGVGDLADVPRDGEVLRSDGIGELSVGDKQQTDATGETECIPDCEGKECGGNGCGGSCGNCGESGACKPDKTCLCEHQKCQGTCCGEGETCLNSGCCLPQCQDKECGEDGCGGICGECSFEQQCGEGGHCECLFAECGGECCQSGDETCHKEACCLPDCSDKECGTDGCGGSCDECGPDYICMDKGDTALCEPDCAAFCAGKECGEGDPDGKCPCGSEAGECDDDNPCTDDECTQDQTCKFTPNSDECDDGNPCTDPDQCDDGECAGQSLSVEELAQQQLLDQCVCDADEDCAAIEDGNFCNGTLFCDKTGEPGICEVDQATIPDCPPDGLFCNGNEKCEQETGNCIHVDAPEVDDGVDCTADSCTEGEDETDNLGQIVHAPDDSFCLNGLWCDGAEWCNAASGCEPGQPPVVGDGVDCTVDSCEEGEDETDNLGQIIHVPDDSICLNGLWCDGTEWCDAEIDCQNGVPPDIGDGIDCTLDSCDEGINTADNLGQLVHLTDDSKCEDGNECTDDSCDLLLDCLNLDVGNGTACGQLVGWTCLDGECQCQPACEGKNCGPDGCGGSCGECGEFTNSYCSDEGTCACDPDCLDKECGDDLCGGTCGECGEEEICIEGQCEWGVLECGGIACPHFAGYDVGCNPKEHCEYANEDSTGWKQWDVWIYVPPGGFEMGSEGEWVAPDELPVHHVELERGYLISKYEIVVAQYEGCHAQEPDRCSTPSTADSDEKQWGTNYWEDGTDPEDPNNIFHKRPEHPQNGLTWQQARDFCGWIAPGGRLPSEAEWEYAATGPVHMKYPWGDSPEPTCSNDTSVFDDGPAGLPWGCDPCSIPGCSGTMPVGGRSAGAAWCGALDMSGNLYEWTEDWYHGSYNGAPVDGSAWLVPVAPNRAIRGGSFASGAVYLRSAERYDEPPSYRLGFMGARCVRAAPANICGGVECPELDGYFVTCNRQDHCEYYNLDTTGHKKWDVWVYVPPGTLQMGCPPDPEDAEMCSETGAKPSDELPQHEVTIEYGYFIGKYEVVVEQYEACMAANPGKCTAADTTDGPGTQGTNTSGNGKSEHPQNGLTWQQGRDFCAWVAPGGRLPSEAEWEYAATGPVHLKYPWGNSPEPTCSNNTAVLNEGGGYGCGQGGTWPAGSKTAGTSWSGALDMSGNLWEWNEDWYHNTYYGLPADGSAWGDPTGSRGRRGGAFSSGANSMRSAQRSNDGPSHRSAELGARCVRPAPPLSGKCGDVECPAMDGYFVTCNRQDHCEYYNENTTGHNKWDVWVYVPPGSFQMGSEGEGGDNDETPVHTVTITKGYFIGKYEIVVEQYEACEADLAEECTSADTMDFPFTQGTNTSGNGRSEHPQNGLTWYQAKDFCGWAAPGGRLPSEAEWEYAATGPTHTKYPWGDIPEPTCSNNTAVFYEAGVVDGFGCGQLGTWKAGSKTTGASWSGALDMSGNLFEWCEDWQHNGYDGAPIDGSAWVDTPDNLTRIIRGGSFDSYAFDLRSARHLSHEPGTSTAVLGARCVRPLEP